MNEIRKDIKNLTSLVITLHNNMSVLQQDMTAVKIDVRDIKTTLEAHTKTLESHTEMIAEIGIDVEDLKLQMRTFN